MGFLSILKEALFKIADRAEVQEKAERIYNSGGVNFISVTIDDDVGRATWEFDVKSTSGETYPIYLDTTTDNPDNTIGWDDIICGCDWSKWNYDRAPEYQHLGDLYCSHGLAVDMWLNAKGQQEYERALRERETGQQELRVDKEKGRRQRPKERLVQDRAQEKGTTPQQERQQIDQNQRNIYQDTAPEQAEQPSLFETPQTNEPMEDVFEEPVEQSDPTKREFQDEDEVLKPRMPGQEDEWEEVEDDEEERRYSSWWSTPNNFTEAHTEPYSGLRKKARSIDYLFVVTTNGDYLVTTSGYHYNIADKLPDDGNQKMWVRGIVNEQGASLNPYSPRLEDEGEMTPAQREVTSDILTEIMAKMIDEGFASEDFEVLEVDLEYPDEKFEGTYIDAISYLASNNPVVGALQVW